MLPCYFKTHFNIECPGCGIQRSFAALLEGDVIGSVQYHPGLLLFLLTFLFTGLHIVFKFKGGAGIILWSFVAGFAVTMINYVLKLTHVY
jgi:hypothetical protein